MALTQVSEKGYRGKRKPIAGRFIINLSVMDSDICFSFDGTRMAVCLFSFPACCVAFACLERERFQKMGWWGVFVVVHICMIPLWSDINFLNHFEQALAWLATNSVSWCLQINGFGLQHQFISQGERCDLENR